VFFEASREKDFYEAKEKQFMHKVTKEHKGAQRTFSAKK